MPSTLQIAAAMIEVTRESWIHEKSRSCSSRNRLIAHEFIHHTPTQAMALMPVKTSQVMTSCVTVSRDA